MKKSTVVYLHIAFWVTLIVSRVVFPLTSKFLSPKELGEVMIYNTFLPPLFFYVGYGLIMRVRWRMSYLLASVLLIVVAYSVMFLISDKLFAYALVPISAISLWTIIGCLFRFFIDWFKKKNDVINLEKENVASNLALLKNQINPHFLFNTLHNIDALIHDNQEKASSSLVKLSDIMRYMLKDVKLDWVELQKEIEHLENYLSLEQLRLKNEKFLSYSIDGNYKECRIAPMLMIPFVENAFKHSVDSTIENGIRIKISVENQTFNFICENDFDTSETDKDKTHGIGLDTVKKRLDLIYKSKYKLSIKSDHSVFKVNLKIQLNEN
ncbi:MAG: histidine kinase [Marinifilum sp.]|jgi:sensor histidine kinase YesM|nr:histidine kinase [Marinifilum sp.]